MGTLLLFMYTCLTPFYVFVNMFCTFSPHATCIVAAGYGELKLLLIVVLLSVCYTIKRTCVVTTMLPILRKNIRLTLVGVNLLPLVCVFGRPKTVVAQNPDHFNIKSCMCRNAFSSST